MKQKISTWFKTYKLVWNFDHWRLIFLSLLGLIQAASVIIQIFAIQNFIDFCQSSTSKFNTIILNLFIIAAVLLFRRIYNAFFNFNINKHIFLVQDITQLKFIEKASTLPLNDFFNTEFETKKNMAKQGANSSSYFLVIGLMLLSFNIPYFIFIGIYYSIFSPYLVLVLLFIIFPSFYAISRNMREYKALEDSISIIRKKINYYFRCIGDIAFIKETKTLNAGDYFYDKINIETNKYLQSTLKHSKYIVKNSLFGDLIKFLGYVMIFIVLITLTCNNFITIGLLAATITSLNDMYSVFNDMVDRDFKSLSSFYYEVENYFEFMDAEFARPQFIDSNSDDIEFKNVCYKYPNSNEFAIKNLNFKISSNETIAIVGENGSGKTTLSRLLLGLLSPTSGEIIINNLATTQDTTKIYSALFQHHDKYPFSLRDNVILSSIDRSLSDSKIKQILLYCGIDSDDLQIFPQSLDTILSREFNGVDISGGQWQRIALARCIYKNGQLLVLDEPTSAIDPLNESTLFSVFDDISQNKTSIIITHRLGIVSISDYIIVMNHGEIIESGTHDELISLNGKYKEMYLAQSSGYFM